MTTTPPIPHIIPILSGKGGVGKSSTTVQLALSLSLRSHSVAVLDIDLTGPSIPRLFNIESSKIRQAPGGWLPVQVQAPTPVDEVSEGAGGRKLGGIWCMSLGFLLRDRGDAVVWRGPKKTAMVKQLLSEVLWPEEIEYLLIDTPPGTSDEHISLVTQLLSSPSATQKIGAVIVTTPQAISTADVKKELSFCEKTNLKVLGVVENMAGFVCPCCGEVTNVFSKGGGQVMAKEWGVEFLGSVPIDGEGWGMLVEEGRRPFYEVPAVMGQEEVDETREGAKVVVASVSDLGTLAEKYTSCSLFPIFDGIAERLAAFQTALPKPPAG